MGEAELPPLPQPTCGPVVIPGHILSPPRAVWTSFGPDDMATYARAAQAQQLAEIERLRAERNAAVAVIAELVRLDDFYIPGPPPHEWDAAWSAARAFLAAPKGHHTMSTEAMKLALDFSPEQMRNMLIVMAGEIKDLRAALAEQAEPVAWIRKHPDGTLSDDLLPNWQIEPVRKNSGAWMPLYAAPQAEQREPLSDEQIVSARDPNCPVCGQHSFQMTPAALAVLSERQRQVLKEGWTFAHDDADHDDGMLAAAGAAYTLAAADKLCPYSQGDGGFDDKPPPSWPGNWQWKPSDPRRMLVKAGALILAEIERLDRAIEAAHGIKP